MINQPVPLSLYIHVPWCIRKCPYCDFNSHTLEGALPEADFLKVIATELEQHLDLIVEKPIQSIFFGGGTPSLLSGEALSQLLSHLRQNLTFKAQVEITLEANPGTIDLARFAAFYQAGVNRLSLGVQSFQDEKLKILGRIHNGKTACKAIDEAIKAGFDNFNIDLMHGLPQQTSADACDDLKQALSFKPTHLSWYQLTLEPNTFFHHHPPILPVEDTLTEIQHHGEAILKSAGYLRYEVSAFAKPQRECLHNKNYWQFGDYLGLGPGAHSKLTMANGDIVRFSQVKHPKSYLSQPLEKRPTKLLTQDDIVFEFMLNALRLVDGVPKKLFEERTGYPISIITNELNEATHRGLLQDHAHYLRATPQGFLFLNDLVGIFLPKVENVGS